MIETERLILRSLAQQDLEDFYEIFSSPKVGRFINVMTHEQVEKYFEKRKCYLPNPFSFAVILKENGKMIGTCGIKFKKENVGTLSYVFNPKYWNNGFCTEACKAVVKYCFENSKTTRIEADCFEDNLASQKILKEKLKFNFEKNIPNYTTNNATGKMTGFNFYAISREEYLDKDVEIS